MILIERGKMGTEQLVTLIDNTLLFSLWLILIFLIIAIIICGVSGIVYFIKIICKKICEVK